MKNITHIKITRRPGVKGVYDLTGRNGNDTYERLEFRGKRDLTISDVYNIFEDDANNPFYWVSKELTTPVQGDFCDYADQVEVDERNREKTKKPGDLETSASSN